MGGGGGGAGVLGTEREREALRWRRHGFRVFRCGGSAAGMDGFWS